MVALGPKGELRTEVETLLRRAEECLKLSEPGVARLKPQDETESARSLWRPRRSGWVARGNWLWVEKGWLLLHAADEVIIPLLPYAMLRARLNDLIVRGERLLGKDDPRVKAAQSFVDNSGSGRVDPEMAYAAATLLHAVNYAIDYGYERLRSFRNVVAWATALAFVGVLAILLLGVLRPSALSLCVAAEAPLRDLPSGVSGNLLGQFVQVCPSRAGMPQRLDIVIVALLGALGAGVSAVATIPRLGAPVDPYESPVFLGLLKVNIGALSSVLGVLAVEQALTSLGTTSAIRSAIYSISFAFGYAQQLFTRAVDKRVSDIQRTLRGDSYL
jgi:hypothetical protein